ncbi:hypothetical protein AXY43_13430 [Clostridium sp. MF28]|uniref:xanthine dehydrogenase n=1 Tax=Clostridium TaxID=1485 RepID=UPI000CF956F9|nr:MULTISPECIES: xanthine dehydrogenase [Clostridium]AVK48945.1 hypothetical protein AXY43_13430 [Clostridium sp. MF28]PSM56492.1 xanthine dehydrogenase [Clostridium diolis]
MDHLFKKTERALYEYKNIDLRIKSIDIYIDRLSNDVAVAGVSYEEKTGPTNAFKSSVEDEVIRRDEHINEELNRLKQSKQDLIILKQLINNGIESLKEEELKIVELRYFQKGRKKTWIEIGMSLGMDKDNCCKAKNKIVNHLAAYIYPNESISHQFFTNI